MSSYTQVAPEVPQLLSSLPLSDDFEYMVQPKHMQAHRWKKEGPHDTLELLIHWQGQSADDAIWESYDLLKSTFPFFPLEDKSAF